MEPSEKNKLLKEAIELSRSGNKEAARSIFEEILKVDPQNEVAYFWYVDTLPSLARQVQSLEQYVKQNPDHERAFSALRSLKKKMVSGDRQSDGTDEMFKPYVAESSGASAQPQAAQEGYASDTQKQVVQSGSSNYADVVVDDAVLQRIREQRHVGAARKPVAKPKKDSLGSFFKAVLALFVIFSCVAVSFIPTLLKSPVFLSPEELYVQDMEPVVVLLEELMDGPVSEWEMVMDEKVYEGERATYSQMLSYTMQMGYADVNLQRKLLPIADRIGMDSIEIYKKMSATTPPQPIQESHLMVMACVEYEMDWAVAISEFLNSGNMSELGDNPCDQFTPAFNQIKRYVEMFN